MLAIMNMLKGIVAILTKVAHKSHRNWTTQLEIDHETENTVYHLPHQIVIVLTEILDFAINHILQIYSEVPYF